LPDASAVRKTVLKVNSFISIDLMGSKGASDKIFRTRDKFLVLAKSNLKDLEEIEVSRERSMPVTCLMMPVITVW